MKLPNQSQLITLFINGQKEGYCSGQGNLKIKGDLLIHYSTTLLERHKSKYILNMSRYSIITGRIQKEIQRQIPKNKLIIVTRVGMNYDKSLVDFIKK